MAYIANLKAKTNQYSRLDKRKVRLEIRGDRTRPGTYSNGDETAAHRPSKAICRFLIAVAVVERHAIVTSDVPGVFMRAKCEPAYRQTMHQTPQWNDTYAAPRKIRVIQRAFNGAT